MTPRDSLAKCADRLRSAAAARDFGVRDARKADAVRHGYLLALEEAERDLDERAYLRQTESSPRDAA